MSEKFFTELQRFGAADCEPVQYTMGGFAVSPARLIDAKDLGDRDPARMLTDHVMAHHTDLWALKLSDWDSEYEYRFVGFVPNAPLGEPIYVPFADCLRAIVLGECFDAEQLDRAPSGLYDDLSISYLLPNSLGQRPAVNQLRPLTRTTPPDVRRSSSTRLVALRSGRATPSGTRRTRQFPPVVRRAHRGADDRGTPPGRQLPPPATRPIPPRPATRDARACQGESRRSSRSTPPPPSPPSAPSGR